MSVRTGCLEPESGFRLLFPHNKRTVAPFFLLLVPENVSVCCLSLSCRVADATIIVVAREGRGKTLSLMGDGDAAGE